MHQIWPQYVLSGYLTYLWNPLVSFVGNCVSAVWMKQLKPRARGQRNIARKPLSDQFYWLYLNPSSFDTLHQHPASAPGHIMYFWELLNSGCPTPFSSHKEHILTTSSPISLLLNSFADPKAGSEKVHVTVRSFTLCWISLKALGTWLPSTLRVYRCTFYCSSSSAMSYHFWSSTERRKHLEINLFTVKV